jgi:hypothetical protein
MAHRADDRSLFCPSSVQKQVDPAAIDPAALAAADYGRLGTGRAFMVVAGCLSWDAGARPGPQAAVAELRIAYEHMRTICPVSLSLPFPLPWLRLTTSAVPLTQTRGQFLSTLNKVDPQKLPSPQTATSPPRPEGPPKLSIYPPRALLAPAGRFLPLSYTFSQRWP